MWCIRIQSYHLGAETPPPLDSHTLVVKCWHRPGGMHIQAGVAVDATKGWTPFVPVLLQSHHTLHSRHSAWHKMSYQNSTQPRCTSRCPEGSACVIIKQAIRSVATSACLLQEQQPCNSLCGSLGSCLSRSHLKGSQSPVIKRLAGSVPCSPPMVIFFKLLQEPWNHQIQGCLHHPAASCLD